MQLQVASKQRIIYMGRILDDTETIQTVLSRHGVSTDSEPIMHLMYTLPDSQLRLRRNASNMQVGSMQSPIQVQRFRFSVNNSSLQKFRSARQRKRRSHNRHRRNSNSLTVTVILLK